MRGDVDPVARGLEPRRVARETSAGGLGFKKVIRAAGEVRQFEYCTCCLQAIPPAWCMSAPCPHFRLCWHRRVTQALPNVDFS